MRRFTFFLVFLLMMSTGIASVEAQMYPNTPISWGFQKVKITSPHPQVQLMNKFLLSMMRFTSEIQLKKIFI